MKTALFLGCTIPVRGQNYEIAARKVAQKLNIDFIDIEEFSCCGFPVKSTDSQTSLLIAARNLAIASKQKLPITTLCNACTSVLTEARKELDANKEMREKINKELKKIGLEYKSGVTIKHFNRLLYEDIGLEKIKQFVEKDLSKLKLSIHYGCHYLRPHELYDCFDDAENPKTVDELVKITGATVVDYKTKLECCGGAILGVEEDIALAMANKKLDEISKKKVDGLITICPFCSIMYEDNQRKIEAKFEAEYNLPVLYYPQVLGLAFGFDKKELGFRLNKVKAEKLLEKIE